MEIALRAAELVEDGNTVGLGSGRAATTFLHALAKRIQDGLRVRGVPTSNKTQQIAEQLQIPLVSINDAERIDLTVDGADEVDPDLNLIKGYGGALVREKIVAAASDRLVILVGSEKLVPVLGSRGTLPVEVVPFGLSFCQRRLERLSILAQPRAEAGELFRSDNGNFILDCQVTDISDACRLDAEIRRIPGVVDTGLFLGLAETVFVQNGDDVVVQSRSRTS